MKDNSEFRISLGRVASRFKTVMASKKWSPKPKLAWEYDQPKTGWQADSEGIRFNGVGEEGHETFSVDSPSKLEFCKTARKPYDIAVCIALLLVKAEFGPNFDYSSDGGPDDWAPAVDVLNKVLPCEASPWEFKPGKG